MEENSIDLNIINRGLSGSSWTAEKGVIDAASLHQVGEQRTDNSGALNALPTPFARFFVVNEAFRRLYEQRRDSNVETGLAYDRLVSDCLDVYELLFNQEYHKARNEKIIIKEWVKNECLPLLKERVPILEKAVSTYYENDLGNTDTLYFIILDAGGKNFLLGTSSPMTGFITPPDLDKKMKDDDASFIGSQYEKMPILKRKDSKGCYFKDILPFEKRSVEFKNYMYNTLFASEVDNRFANIRDYIKSFAADSDIKNDYSQELNLVKTEENSNLVINGICLSYNNNVGNYFTDAIIRMPYRISSENYMLPEFEEKHDYDYLLPLSEDAISRLDLANVSLKYKESRRKITVSLVVNGKEYEKNYFESPQKSDDGKIIDLPTSYKVNFDIALFPRVRTGNMEFDNYYKLMLVAKDGNSRQTFSVDDISCDFFTKADKGGYNIINEALDSTYKSGVKKTLVRSVQNKDSACGTKYYELFNSNFDIIRLKIRLEGEDYCGVLMPRWQNATKTQKSFIYAIDFGTTNTFISRRERSEAPKEPEQLTMKEPIVSYLHAKTESSQKDEIYLWEDVSEKSFLDYFQTEFIPTFIDGKLYKFPLRTALCKAVDEVNSPKLFDNRNIAFSYGKKKIVGHNEITTDIKWNEELVKTEAGLFIQELLMMIKYDLLQENANLSNTELIWFRPLSFKGSVRKMYESLWAEKAKQVLGIEGSQIKCYTESEAPYYYFSTKNAFKGISSVALVDIGGGSTDFVLFENENPKLANSVHFGCDVLWGNGYDLMSDAKTNGIYQHYLKNIEFKSDELKELNRYLLSGKSKSSTKDIINFWLEHDEETNIHAKLLKDYRPLFLYHYAAVIFYFAEMLKSKGLSCPSDILFSGNGSRYIDNFITKDVEVLGKLTMIILKDRFPDGKGNTVKLHLPDYRKECTCYGGLYRKNSDISASPYVFMGVDDKQYKDIGEIKVDFENGLCDKLISQITNMNRLYIEMLSEINKLDGDKMKLGDIECCISDDIETDLKTNFQKQVVTEDDGNLSMSWEDSLFFLPVVNRILKLTKIKE